MEHLTVKVPTKQRMAGFAILLTAKLKEKGKLTTEQEVVHEGDLNKGSSNKHNNLLIRRSLSG